MNKQAAEKIASEYYQLGGQLALQKAGITKTASAEASLLRKILGGAANTASIAGLGIAGAGLGHLGARELAPNIAGLKELSLLLGAGAGAAKGFPQAVKVRTPDVVWQAPGLFGGGFRLRP